VYRPDLLVIGAAGRNCGKTELASRLIRRHASSSPVVGLKVTTVERADGSCPRGGAGCGVCSSLTVPWVVSREDDCESPKDTCRLLASGARQVYWLRVLRSELAAGAADLLRHVPSGWLGVCESNSLVSVVEPGLFLQVRTAGNTRAKRSAQAVAHLADWEVASDGRSFDLDLDSICVVDGQWALRRDACAVVVDDAEGRVETDRTVALRGTRASLEPQFARVVVGPRTGDRSAVSWLATVSPDPPHEWFFVAPATAAGVPAGLVNAMFRRRVGVDVVVAVTRSHGQEVSVALCSRGLLQAVIAALGRGAGAVAALTGRCTVRELRCGAAGSGAPRLEGGRSPIPVEPQPSAGPGPAIGGGAEAT